MKITSKQAEQLKNAIIDAYPTRDKLRMMLSYGLDQDSLDAIALGDNLGEIVFKLLEWAKSTGQLSQLLVAARKRNPGNELLHAFVDTFPYLLIGAEPDPENLSDPYRGLAAFTATDEAFFFGRDNFTRQLVEKVYRQQLVVVLGASGSGKSSLVFAGLVPKLKAEQEWMIADFRPGPDPFKSLMATLLPLYEQNDLDFPERVQKKARRIRAGELHLTDIINRIIQLQSQNPETPPPQRFLLIADQFEQIFTLCEDTDTQKAFLKTLLSLIETPSEFRVHLVFTLRADFMGQALELGFFSDDRKNADLKLESMSRSELEAAITQPAETQDIFFEPGLVTTILDDVDKEPGNLPLMEFALMKLWGCRIKKHLTHDAYEGIGGVKGALMQHAEEVYSRLNIAQQQQARHIFTQVVKPGQGTEDTRRITTHSELNKIDWSLVTELASKRLIVTSRNEEGEETVEVAHEALIKNWGRLRQWMQEDGAFRTWQDQLRISSKQWRDNNRDEHLLLRGNPLRIAEDWLAERSDELSEDDEEFIQAGLTYRQQLDEEKAQRIREEDIQKRKEKRRNLFLGFSMGGLVLLGIIAGVIFYLYQQAKIAEQEALGARNEAIVAQKETDGLRLALASANQRHTNHELALLLAIEAVDRVNSLETNTTLRRSLLHRGQTVAWLTDHAGKVKQVAWSPANNYFLTQDDRNIKIWDARTWQLVNNITTAHNIRHAIWGPDGHFIAVATGGEGNTVEIWSATHQKPKFVLPHTNAVNYLAWHQADNLLATAGQDKRVKVWDLSGATPIELYSLAHAGPVSYVTWNNDGSQLVTISQNKTSIWDVKTETKKPNLTLANDGRLVEMALWDASEKYLLTVDNQVGGGQIGNVYVWDAQTGNKIETLSHPAVVNQARWNKEGNQILTAGDDGLIRVWDVTREEPALTLTGHNDSVYEVTWNENEDQILSAGKDGVIRIWAANSGNQVANLTGHRASVNQAIWNHDETQVISVSDDKTIRIWDPQPGSEISTLTGHHDGIVQVSWSINGGKIATASEDNTARIWDAESGKQLSILKHKEPVNQVVWSPNGEYLATVGIEGLVRVWRGENGQLLATGDEHQGFVVQAEWFKDTVGQLRIVTASEDHTARIWKFIPPDLLRPEHTLQMDGPVNQAIWNNSGTQVATAAFDSNTAAIRLWDAETGDQILGLGPGLSEIRYIDWQKSDSKVVSAGDDGQVRVWDPSTGLQIGLLSTHEGIVNQASWQPDGDLIVTASDDGTAKIWQPVSGELRYTLYGHENNVNQANWSWSGNLILTASNDKTARIWEAETGQQISLLEGHTGFVNQAIWDKDDRRIVTVSEDGTARLYYVTIEDLHDAACKRAVRNMSQAEWSQYMENEPYQETCPGKPIPN